MIKIALQNIKLLSLLNKLPVLKYFFIFKINETFNKITDNKILEKFYTDIYMTNKTSKKTSNQRFKDINQISLKYFSKSQTNYIHDLAVSNGITSDNLYIFLNQNNISFQMDISDKYAKIFVKEGFITKVFDTDKNLIFAYWGIFFAGDKNIYFPLTVLLYKIIKKHNKCFNSDYSLYLYHPEIIKKWQNKQIEIIDYDIFNNQLNKKYTYVRCMNILNRGYFSEIEIKKALANIKSIIKEQGILQIGRTDSSGKNRVSWFKKENKHFVLLEDYYGGSEIKHLVLNK